MVTIRILFFKIRVPFSIFKKGQGRALPLPLRSLIARLLTSDFFIIDFSFSWKLSYVILSFHFQIFLSIHKVYDENK